ncbi:winged helix-turn-helix transcriptional regulator [Streptomyces physcomitrii]|uniref:Helix-turn-helix transcriptional regulator n=1 Tax=Streptomyces physcomitrii TaxID=2724184 RepID=A0ABX1GVL7_9ACTN|nr:helix-turn-helix domain-containing protein [Streptomyces physcomitrii]NKI40123.1 helix-turn-helix transcriptional regulator [Streptomyces physcomitrii]
MALGTDYAQQDCSLARALEVVGERWSLLIVRDAFYGVRRFNDFLAHLDIPRAVLTSRLRSLVAAGVLRKETYQSSPTRYGYVLTETGRELWLPLYGLAQWGERHVSERGARTLFSHADCGTRLDRHGSCPQCLRPVPPEDVMMRPGTPDQPREDPVSRALGGPHRLLTPITVDGTGRAG